MSDEEYTIEVYALYHCDPGNSPLSIAEFNEIVGCNIPENEKVENHIRKLRAQFGPNEVIQMEWWDDLSAAGDFLARNTSKSKKKSKSGKKSKFSKNIKERLKKKAAAAKAAVAKKSNFSKNIKERLKKKAAEAKAAVAAAKKGLVATAKEKYASRKTRKAAENAERKKRKAAAAAEKQKEELEKMLGKGNDKSIKAQIAEQEKIIKDNKLHDEYEETAMDYSSTEETAEESSFSLEDALLESEYEDLCDKCDGPKEACDHEFEDQVEAMSIEDAQTLQHLVAFKSKCSNIEDRVMKGKGRYMEALKSYMNGDTDQEIRMFNGKKVKISSLQPSIESLKEMFSTFPQGPHIIDCV